MGGREDHCLARTIKECMYIRVNNPTLNRNVDGIAFIIYGTESCPTPLTLKLVMIMGMYTEHPSVGMLSPFQPIGMCIELWGILCMFRPLRMHTEHLRTNIRCSKSLFSLRPNEVQLLSG